MQASRYLTTVLLVALAAACTTSAAPGTQAGAPPAAGNDDASNDTAPAPPATAADAGGGGVADPGGPVLLSVTMNATRMTPAASVRFVVLVTHPEGLSRLVGGKLSTPDGAATYGAFTADQQGAYSLSLTWAELNQVAPITFPYAKSEARSFLVEFYDSAGRKASKIMGLELACSVAASATDGRCDPLTPCAPAANKSCDEICGGMNLACTQACPISTATYTLFATSLFSKSSCPNTTWSLESDGCAKPKTEGSFRCCCR
jgi:hypothetical protein